MKKNIIFCIIDDSRDTTVTPKFVNSIRKFHTEEELPIKVIKREEYPNFMADPDYYLRAKALIANEFIDEYDTVMIADSDQIMTGDIKHLISLKDYDVGTVLNFNERDAKEFGLISTYNINPQEYLNAGFIAIRSKEFVDHWLMLCSGKFFYSLPMREQDLLNIICHYGNYNVRIFDLYDPEYDYSSFHGLISKGWWDKVVLNGEKMMLLPKHVPALLKPCEVKMIHWAGGNSIKMNYRIYFNEECIKRLDYLVSEGVNEK